MGPLKRSDFEAEFSRLFDERFESLFHYLDRLTGEPALAADVAQEAFVRLYRRGSMPDMPASWLVAVAHNLFRTVRRDTARRRTLRATRTAASFVGDPVPTPEAELERGEGRRTARAALDALPERERRLLLLRTEGYSYREIARALDIREASVGSLLLRAKRAFRAAYGEGEHAHR